MGLKLGAKFKSFTFLSLRLQKCIMIIFKNNCLGLWISCTLTNKKENYISKQTYYNNNNKKTRIKKKRTKNYLVKENKQKKTKHKKEK
jgi:hypothetical protein